MEPAYRTLRTHNLAKRFGGILLEKPLFRSKSEIMGELERISMADAAKELKGVGINLSGVKSYDKERHPQVSPSGEYLSLILGNADRLYYAEEDDPAIPFADVDSFDFQHQETGYPEVFTPSAFHYHNKLVLVPFGNESSVEFALHIYPRPSIMFEVEDGTMKSLSKRDRILGYLGIHDSQDQNYDIINPYIDLDDTGIASLAVDVTDFKLPYSSLFEDMYLNLVVKADDALGENFDAKKLSQIMAIATFLEKKQDIDISLMRNMVKNHTPKSEPQIKLTDQLNKADILIAGTIATMTPEEYTNYQLQRTFS